MVTWVDVRQNQNDNEEALLADTPVTPRVPLVIDLIIIRINAAAFQSFAFLFIINVTHKHWLR